jgi:glycosyltransferase involved in cell wall biosynthesis
MKITIVLLTWQRIASLKRTLLTLSNQTYKDFDVYISNSSERSAVPAEKYAKYFSDKLSITFSQDSNENYAYRRLTIARDLAKKGTEIVLFIDDDITISEKYVQEMLAAYEPNSYCSAYAWRFSNNGQDYYRHRSKVSNNLKTIHYCGTAASVVDASIFLDDNLFNHPKEVYLMEDLWLSYFAQHVKGWRLKYVPLGNIHIGGSDPNALYKKIMKDKANNGTPDKADFLRTLVNEYGWELKD